jgi:predicted aspartyl protease
MSQSEAKRLGLTIRESPGTLGTSTGERVGFHTAGAREVAVGGIRFRDVSFAVFQDTEAPWSALPSGRRGRSGFR